MQGNDVRGYLTEAPGLTVGTWTSIDPHASFLTNDSAHSVEVTS